MTPLKPGDRVHLKGHAHTPATLGTVEDFTPFRVYVRWDDGRTLTPHDHETLELVGEPMSTEQHFGNAYGTLKVRENGESGSIYITIDSQGSCAGVGIEEAPALALAILEAAGIADKGFNESSDAEMAVAHLASHVGLERANAKAVADQKVLEAEAFTLYSAAPFTSGVQSFELLSDGAKVQWLSIARAARDLHGVTK